MDIAAQNLWWISENVALAFLGVVFGWAFLYARQKIIKWLLFALWILFLPNTIYMVTDIQYLPSQWARIDPSLRIILLAQFVTVFSLGIITYLLAMHPLEKLLARFRKNQLLVVSVIAGVNFAVAFAVALGKFQRVNSWDVFTDPAQVTDTSQIILAAPDTLVKIFLFGVFCNVLYFSFRKAFRFDSV